MKRKLISITFILILMLIFPVVFASGVNAPSLEYTEIIMPTQEELISPSEQLIIDEKLSQLTEETCLNKSADLDILENAVPEDTSPSTSSVLEYNETFIEQWQESAVYLAKTVWGEARGVSKEGQEKVIWCILNRVDDSRFPNTIIEVITAPNQFHGYSSNFPCEDEMYNLALDVIYRWQLEKMGGESSRNLSAEYVYFCADSSGLSNVFRTHW